MVLFLVTSLSITPFFFIFLHAFLCYVKTATTTYWRRLLCQGFVWERFTFLSKVERRLLCVLKCRGAEQGLPPVWCLSVKQWLLRDTMCTTMSTGNKSKVLFEFRKRKKNSHFVVVFTSFIKKSVRKFLFVIVQSRRGVLHVQNCCFSY